MAQSTTLHLKALAKASFSPDTVALEPPHRILASGPGSAPPTGREHPANSTTATATLMDDVSVRDKMQAAPADPPIASVEAPSVVPPGATMQTPATPPHESVPLDNHGDPAPTPSVPDAAT
ncbi:hypothetical protein ACA910_019548 [Epithemia clementina (nom. ined.)]